MRIKYAFANETVEIEVSEDWGNILIDLDREEYNVDHKETRRHCSLDALNLDDAYLPSDVDVLAEVIRGTDAEKLRHAISQLEPYQQELIKSFYFDDVPISTYAQSHGITQSAASHQKTTALKKLKKFLE